MKSSTGIDRNLYYLKDFIIPAAYWSIPEYRNTLQIE